jgi:RNA polymerase sigma-70 factor (ECF subfamily)
VTDPPGRGPKADRSAGDEARTAGYDRVVRETADSLYRYLRYLLHDEEAAREVFQETYLRVFRALEGFRGESSVTTWVLTIGRNLVMNRRRSETLRTRWQGPWEASLDAPSTTDAADEAAERRLLLDAMASLPEPQREAVFLHYVEDRSVNDIAAATGRPVNTVKSDLMRARARLRETLGAGAAQREPR